MGWGLFGRRCAVRLCLGFRWIGRSILGLVGGCCESCLWLALIVGSMVSWDGDVDFDVAFYSWIELQGLWRCCCQDEEMPLVR